MWNDENEMPWCACFFLLPWSHSLLVVFIRTRHVSVSFRVNVTTAPRNRYSINSKLYILNIHSHLRRETYEQFWFAVKSPSYQLRLDCLSTTTNPIPAVHFVSLIAASICRCFRRIPCCAYEYPIKINLHFRFKTTVMDIVDTHTHTMCATHTIHYQTVKIHEFGENWSRQARLKLCWLCISASVCNDCSIIR